MAKLSELFNPEKPDYKAFCFWLAVKTLIEAVKNLKHESWCDTVNGISTDSCNCMLTDVYFALKDLNE
jgi:hypothetical protein